MLKNIIHAFDNKSKHLGRLHKFKTFGKIAQIDDEVFHFLVASKKKTIKAGSHGCTHTQTYNLNSMLTRI